MNKLFFPEPELTGLKNVRDHFPFLSAIDEADPLIYFDSAATSQKPWSVIKTMTEFDSEKYATIHRAAYRLGEEATQKYEEARKHVARFLGVKDEKEIVFTSGTTQSINLVAYSFGKKFISKGDEIIISSLEHHANIIPWQTLCEEKGALLRVIPVDDKGDLILKEYEKLLSKKTKIVAVTHVSNALGTVIPVKEIIKMAHEFNAKVLVDGAQSAAHLKIDLQEMDADFYVASGHKMYGPTGVGFLFGKYELLESMPPYVTGGDMIKSVTFEKTVFADPPSRFEAGTPPITQVLGLNSALSFIEQIGYDEITKHEAELLEFGTSILNDIPGIKIIGTTKNKTGIISFVMEGVHPHDIATLLSTKGIAIRGGHHCAQPVMKRFNVPATSRISFGIYNTKEELETLGKALLEIKKMFD